MSTPSASPPFPGRGPARLRRRRLPYLLGALLVALIVAGLWPRPLPVESAVAARGPLRVTVDEEGRTRVKQRYVVSSPVAGQLRRIELKPGAEVVAGETVLAVLETSGADLLDARSLAQAEARVRATESAREGAVAQRERARAAASLARADLRRLRSLGTQGLISQQDLETAQARELTAGQEERAAEFALRVAEFELEQARAALLLGSPGGVDGPALAIKSPVGGRILRVMQESARTVAGGMPLLEVGDPTDLEVVIEALSRDAVAMAPGTRVLLEQWGGPQPLEARVRWVEPAGFTKISALGVEEQRVNVIADFVDPVNTRPTLGDAYRVEARIVMWEGEDVLRVPAGALFQQGGTWYTYVIDAGRARLRPLTPGRSNGRETEIREGLSEGARVIVYPGDRIADGIRVRPLSAAGTP